MDKSVRFFAEYEEHRFFDLLSFDLAPVSIFFFLPVWEGLRFFWKPGGLARN